MYDGCQKLPFITNDKYLLQLLTAQQYILDLRRINILPQRGLKHILQTIRNPQISTIKLSDISRMKPSFFIKNLSCSLRTIPVTLHHVRTLHQNLPFFTRVIRLKRIVSLRSQYFFRFDVLNRDHLPWCYPAHRAVYLSMKLVHSNQRTRLTQTIAFLNPHSQIGKKFADMDWQSAGPTDKDF